MDESEIKLITLLQHDAERSLPQLAELLHLSESSVRRRIASLQKRGILDRKVWLLNRENLPGVSAIVTVSFGQETVAGYQRFKAKMRADVHVSQCYTVAGSHDFVLLVHAPTLAQMEAWHERELMTDPTIRRSESQVVWSVVKFETQVPLG